MELKNIVETQYVWSSKTFKEIYKLDKLEKIKYFTIALSGEVGEFANVVKKLLRDYYHKKDNLKYEEKLKEELIDVFIYVILLSKVLDMDLEKEWLAKFEKNKIRFKNYQEE